MPALWIQGVPPGCHQRDATGRSVGVVAPVGTDAFRSFGGGVFDPYLIADEPPSGCCIARPAEAGTATVLGYRS
jgi:hypothetical protein